MKRFGFCFDPCLLIKLVLSEWKHGIFREHINDRRIALTMREPSQKFRVGGELYEKHGKELIQKGGTFVEI